MMGTQKRLIRGTRQRKQIVVKKTGHPAAFRKMRCQACGLGYCIEDNVEKGKFTCNRCGATFGVQAL
jgi:hypothetical protein